jgi:hypothetical protein
LGSGARWLVPMHSNSRKNMPLQRMVSVIIITKKQGMVKAASPAPSDECSRKICSGAVVHSPTVAA